MTTPYDFCKVKWQFSTWTLGFLMSGWPDVQRRRIRRSPVVVAYILICDHMFILDTKRREKTAGRPCATWTNLVRAYIFILILTGVCVALKDIGRWHPLAILENNSKRREYTQIVCKPRSHSLSHYISLTIFISVSVFLNWCVCLRL